MFTPKCTRKGCGWVGTPKDTEAKATQAVKMHVGRLHDKSIPTYKGGPFKKKKLHANGNGNLAVATLPRSYRGVKLHAHTRNGHTHVHAHSKPGRPASVPAVQPNGTEVKVNFCNNCGASIEGQAQGIVIANLLKTNSRFRAKVEKLLAKV